MNLTSEKKIVFIFLFLTIFVFSILGFQNLGKFVTTDEQFWIYERIPEYWKGILEKKFKKTYINDKPGVSLAIISGTGLLFENNPEKNHKISGNETLDEYKIEYTEKINNYFRIPLVAATIILLFYIFWIIKKLFRNEWIALWSVILIAFFPILLGISRVINPDALLWSLSFSAAISYFCLMKYGERKYIILTSLFLGLALLTKYVANILIPFFFLTSFLNYFLNFEKNFKDNPEKTGIYFYKQIRNIFFIFFSSAFLFAILMPASILKLKHLYNGTLGAPGLKMILPYFFSLLLIIIIEAKINKGVLIHKIFFFLNKSKKVIFSFFNLIVFSIFIFVLANWMSFQKIIDLSRIPVDARSKEIFVQGTSFFEKIILEFFPFVFTIPPLVLLFFLFILWKNIAGKNKPYSLYTTSISILVIIFFLGGIMSGVLFTPRYDILLFPFIGFLASLGLFSFSEKYFPNLRTKILISVSIFFISFITVFLTRPFYYNYASPLLPKNYTTNNTWGFGGYEAAQYLNSLPDAENLVIWSDYRGVCEFSRGKCIITTKFDREKYPVDYYVLTRRGQSRMNFRIIQQFEEKKITPDWELFIGGRSENYIKVISAKNQI